MKKQNKHTTVVQDERIEFVTNKYAAKAMIFLAWYLFLSVLIKSFTLDSNIFLFYDIAIAMAAGLAYIIYRAAGEGVPFAPTSVTIFEKSSLFVYGLASLLIGVFITFYAAGLNQKWDAYFSGTMEKMGGAVIIGILFFIMVIFVIWLIDILPTKLAFRKASELIGEPYDDRPEPDEMIKESAFRDERIDLTIEKYAAHAFYFLFGYILLSSVIKLLIADIRMIVYADTFITAMLAGGYFIFNMLKSGIHSENKLSRNNKFSSWITFAISFLVAGMIMSFIVFPMDDQLAAKLGGITDKFFLGIFLALLFGIGKILIDKVMDLYARKQAKKFVEE